jgi:hypothetical protein
VETYARILDHKEEQEAIKIIGERAEFKKVGDAFLNSTSLAKSIHPSSLLGRVYFPSFFSLSLLFSSHLPLLSLHLFPPPLLLTT